MLPPQEHAFKALAGYKPTADRPSRLAAPEHCALITTQQTCQSHAGDNSFTCLQGAGHLPLISIGACFWRLTIVAVAARRLLLVSRLHHGITACCFKAACVATTERVCSVSAAQLGKVQDLTSILAEAVMFQLQAAGDWLF